MDKLIEELRNWGADTDGGIQRVMNDEEFYRMLILKFADSPEFQSLEAALDRGDRKEAFRIAHSLKGASANLSLTPFCRAVSDVVEDLRRYSAGGECAPSAAGTGAAAQGSADPAARTEEAPGERPDRASDAEADAALELHLQQYRMERDLLLGITRKYAG